MKLTEYEFLGPKHCSFPLLINCLAPDLLKLNELKTQNGVDMLQYGRRILDIHGRTAFFPWRDLNKAKQGWTPKHRLLLFRGAREKFEKDTEKYRKTRVRRAREEKHRKTIGVRACRLARAQKSGNDGLCELIEAHIDLVHPEALVFMEEGKMSHATQLNQKPFVSCKICRLIPLLGIIIQRGISPLMDTLE